MAEMRPAGAARGILLARHPSLIPPGWLPGTYRVPSSIDLVSSGADQLPPHRVAQHRSGRSKDQCNVCRILERQARRQHHGGESAQVVGLAPRCGGLAPRPHILDVYCLL
jgi:hypothetical protein